MVHLSMTPDYESLIVELPFLDKILAFHAPQIDVKLAHVIDARPWKGGYPLPDVTRFRGTVINGTITEGTERMYNGKLRFYDVKTPSRAVDIELDHERYERMIVEVHDLSPDEACRTLLDYAERARLRDALEHSPAP